MTENEQQLQRLLSGISPLYEAPMREAKARQDALAKPPGSLGLLEEISIRLAGITGTVKNEASPTCIYVLAADNGVVSEGVSSAPQSVTRAQAINLTRGLTGASCLAKHFHDGLTVVDMGIALPYTCPEILALLEKYQVTRCYYGHLHGASHRRAIEGTRSGTLFSLVAGDFLGFIPKKICE